jgi:hypothetical protein
MTDTLAIKKRAPPFEAMLEHLSILRVYSSINDPAQWKRIR